MSRQVILDNWAFGLIPDHKGNIVALFGTVVETGQFLGGSSRIVSYQADTKTATSETGTQYVLREPDQSVTTDDLVAAINQYSK